MLRRNFLKSTFIAGGGLMLLGRIPLADNAKGRVPKGVFRSRKLALHGHCRSGCATRPELAAAIEEGLFSLPE